MPEWGDLGYSRFDLKCKSRDSNILRSTLYPKRDNSKYASVLYLKLFFETHTLDVLMTHTLYIWHWNAKKGTSRSLSYESNEQETFTIWL